MRHELAQLLDLGQMQRLLDSFCDVVGIAAGIIDLDGNVLVGARWQRICTGFHRTAAATRARCIDSDTCLANELRRGERYSLYRCRNGLTDAASPIHVEGEHVANAFAGQFLTEPADQDQFRRRAAENGFDERAYLEALAEVPIIPEERLPAVVRFLSELAQMIGELGLREVTRRADAERLRESEHRFRAIFDQTFEFIGLMKPDGTLIEANRTALDFIGAERADVVGRPFWETPWWTHSPELQQRLRAAVEAAAGGEQARLEVTHMSADGALSTREFSLKPVRDQAGQVVLLIPESYDVTERRRTEQERKQLEAQLRQAQKMEAIGQLAGGVAHDFNNILTTILGNVELSLDALRERLPADDPTLRDLQHVEVAAHRAAGLTRRLMAFGRRDVAQPELLDLNATLTELEKMLRRLISEDITLEVLRGGGLKAVRADAGQIEQVVMNLVVNARDAMPGGGTLTLETANVSLDESYVAAHAEAHVGPHVTLAVGDTGCGMGSEILERIFEPFFTTKEIGRGTGLGLAMVYGIIRQSDGHVTVHSEPGRGSTFKVHLPAFDVPAARPEPAVRETHALIGGETVLVCEDDETVRLLATSVLREAGYTVLAAGDGEQALELAGKNDGRIQLLLTDVIMPGMNGRQLADRLVAAMPGLRVLFVSGYTANVIAHHGVLDEGVEFLEKPFSRRGLLRRVREVLDGRPALPS